MRLQALVEIIKKSDALYNVIVRIDAIIYSVIREKHSLCVLFYRFRSLVLKKNRVELYNKRSLKSYCVYKHSALNSVEGVKSRDVFVPKYYGYSDESKIIIFKSSIL